MRSYKWEFSPKMQMPDNDDLLWLYKNYVLDCPVTDTSKRGRTLRQIGWKTNQLHILKQNVSEKTGLNNCRWMYIDKIRKDEEESEDLRFEKALDELGTQDSYFVDTEFVVYYHGGKNKIEALLYLIRNSLAHGSFRFHRVNGTSYLAMQTSKKGKLKGRALLSMKTLRKIRSLVNNPPK